MRKVDTGWPSGQVHCFQVLGDRLALDVGSGAVHRLDEVSGDVIREISEGDASAARARACHGQTQAEDALSDVSELRRQGLLFAPVPAFPTVDDSIADPVAPAIVKSLCMNIAHDCNLRCSYCFASTGAYKGHRRLMSSEVGRASVDFLIEHSGPRQACEMDFFGGEPLLNMAVVRDTVAYARKREAETGKRFRFTLTTNATLLTDEIGRFLNEQEMQVILSIDGRPEVHDRFRCYPDGSGSHRTALDRTRKFLESRDHANYYVRGTYTRRNLDFAADAQYFLDHGITAFSLEPAVVEESLDYSIRQQDLAILSLEYDRLVQHYLDHWRQGRPYTFYHFEVDLSGGPCLRKRMSGCGAGREYFAISPDGGVYACHQFDGDAEFLSGNVLGEVDLAPTRRRFGAAGLQHKQACAACWARFHCGGGCHSAAWAKHKDLLIPDPIACEIQKKRLECAIYAQAIKASESSEQACDRIR